MKRCFGFFIFLFCVGSVFGMEEKQKCRACGYVGEDVELTVGCARFMGEKLWGSEDGELSWIKHYLCERCLRYPFRDACDKEVIFRCVPCAKKCLKSVNAGKKFLRKFFARDGEVWDVTGLGGETVRTGRFVKHVFKRVSGIRINSFNDFEIEFLEYLCEKTKISRIEYVDKIDEEKCKEKIELLLKNGISLIPFVGLGLKPGPDYLVLCDGSRMTFKESRKPVAKKRPYCLFFRTGKVMRFEMSNKPAANQTRSPITLSFSPDSDESSSDSEQDPPESVGKRVLDRIKEQQRIRKYGLDDNHCIIQ